MVSKVMQSSGILNFTYMLSCTAFVPRCVPSTSEWLCGLLILYTEKEYCGKKM